jgi:Phosphoesterase family
MDLVRRALVPFTATVLFLCVTSLVTSPATAAQGSSQGQQGQGQGQKGRAQPVATISTTGLARGAIKHVWLIVLENKSYDATFTGLNDNSYLWKDLPAQGALLTNYYGTGHSSMDNYLSLISGQAPSEDVQEDCSTTDDLLNLNSGIETAGGSLSANPDYGQLLSKAGPNAPLGDNGCSFPTDVPTLFNQLNAAGLTWKDYDQDLGGEQNYLQHPHTAFQSETVPGREDAACGGAGTASNNPNTDPLDLATPPGGPIASYTGAQSASSDGTDYIDQYVAKHNPAPWFEALTGQVNSSGADTPPLNEPVNGGTNCDSDHVVNLDNPTNGLVADLVHNTVPAFSWITPDNCSDAHDAVCKGNNLSGAFNADGTPNYETGTSYAYDPETIQPKNYTGGLYSADLFLEYYIPLIEQSRAFRDGGLIDITFDEGFPPFTYSGDSFNNEPTSGAGQPADAPTYGAPGTTAPGADSIFGAYGILSDQAGENIDGRNVGSEPTGPNSTLQPNGVGDQLYPGPGNNSFIDRPPACTSISPAPVPPNCVPGIVSGGSGSSPGARTDQVTTTAGSSIIVDNSIEADDTGRAVTGPDIPANSFVGTVSDTGPNFPTTNTGSATSGQFQLVDQSGAPIDLVSTGAQTVTLSAEGAPGYLTSGETPDPLYDATDPTPGGGDTGSVLISPYISPGTVSNVYYNHYSWLRTMEDLFDVSAGNDWTPLSPGTGTVSGGLDAQGHLGYAAQPGLRPFGPDVFTNPEAKSPPPPPPRPRSGNS